jgi:enolase
MTKRCLNQSLRAADGGFGLRALEILDPRGDPTLRVQVRLEAGVTASASVPSGASTGENEAVELRDAEAGRDGGKGVRKAVAGVNDVIAPRLVSLDPVRQVEIDRLLIELDDTSNKAHLGANAILGVSMAVARSAAAPSGCRFTPISGIRRDVCRWDLSSRQVRSGA